MKKTALLTFLIPLTLQAWEDCSDSYDCDPCDYSINCKLSVSPLLWQAHEEGLDYAIKNESGLAFINNNGKVQRIDSDWEWGVRLNLEYQTCGIGDLEAQWTYFRSTETDSISATFPEAIFTVWTTPGSSIPPSTEASARWKIKINLFDLRLGARYNPTCFFELHPFLALTTGWIDQKFSIKSSGGVSRGGAALIVLDDDIEMQNDFWGIGPKFGFKTTWDLGCGFSLFGNADISILYGKFDLSQHETILFEGLTPATTFLDLRKDKFWLSRVNLDFILGFRYEWIFCCGDYSLGFEAAWENLFFFGQNQLKRFIDDINHGIQLPVKGDLTIQGLTLTARFGF